MRVDIDEPRRNDQPLRVDDPGCGGIGAELPHGRDPVSFDRQIALEPGITSPIDDRAAADQDVVHLARLSLGRCQRGCGCESQKRK